MPANQVSIYSVTNVFPYATALTLLMQRYKNACLHAMPLAQPAAVMALLVLSVPLLTIFTGELAMPIARVVR